MARVRKRKALPGIGLKPKPHFASIFPGLPPHPLLTAEFALPPGLVESVRKLEMQLQQPVWLLVQDKDGPDRQAGDSFNMLGDQVAKAFFAARHSELRRGQKVAILIDSNGGLAKSSYEIATLLRRHCGGFTAVIPRHAKSAATLLSLGADRIVMNDFAELGPLDVQIWDPDREDLMSGLDEVQSLERLQAFAFSAMDRMTVMMLKRTDKKVKNILPFVTEFVAKLTHPMFEGIDVVRYTQMSRALKVAEEYGKRLLRTNYGDSADSIASNLVERYPEHGFPIYPDEAVEIGLRLPPVSAELRAALESVARELPNLNVIGRIIS